MAQVQFSNSFKRRIKALSKRYRQIQNDIQPIINALESDQIIGDQIVGTNSSVFKVRAKNSDIPTGKSGGYRLVYQLVSPDLVLLLLIYAKSDQADVSVEEIRDLIDKASHSTDNIKSDF